MTLSIIIVNTNAVHYIPDCLDSIYNYPLPFKVEVFVVDNASTDGSPELIEEKYPQVKLIRNKDNLGFAAANNRALKQAKGKYQLLLNPDTRLVDDALVKVVNFMAKHPEAGCVGCRLLNDDGSIQWSCHNYATIGRVLLTKLIPIERLYHNLPDRFKLAYTKFDYGSTCMVDYIKGAFMMFRKEALDTVGLLDEQFFMYAEEADMCLRLKEKGWNTLYFPGATIQHAREYYSKMVPSYFTQARRTISRYKFMKKYHGALYAETYRLISVVFNLVSLPIKMLNLRNLPSTIFNSRGYLKALCTLEYPK